MDNPQDIQWFAGFFEGEGSMSFRYRRKRGKTDGFFYEPKISISNTNEVAIDHCEKLLQSHSIDYSKTWSTRVAKLDCAELNICSGLAISLFTDLMKPYIECDKVRLDCFSKFVQSRMSRDKFSLQNDNELKLVEKHNQWRSSETTCEESYTNSLDWLAGIYEAEGSFTNHGWTGSAIIQLCNTNFSIICKAQKILQSLLINPHIKKYEATKKHQAFWHLTLCGKNKCELFIEYLLAFFRYRQSELVKIKI